MWQRFTSVFIKVDIILHLTALRIKCKPHFVSDHFIVYIIVLVHQQKYLLHICTEPLKLSNYFDYKMLICI